MKFIYTIIFSAFVFILSAQDGMQVKIDIENYPQDTAVIGYYYAKNTLVQDTLIKEDDGSFVYQDSVLLDPGVYIILLKPDNQFVQFLVGEGDSKIDISFDFNDLTKLEFKGSPENKLFSDYMAFLSDKRTLRTELTESFQEAAASGGDSLSIQASIDMLDKEVEEYQSSFINQHPKSITTLLIKANRPIDTPEFEGTAQEINQQKYEYYRIHYFDNIELDNPLSLRTPFLHDRVNYFLQKLTYQVPDSINKSVDFLLNEVSPAEETYKYYLSHLLNEYANSKVVGLDAVYVYLTDNYYKKNKAPWIDEENLKKIIENSDKISPTLIGKTAPSFEVFQRDGSKITLDEFDAEYKVLFFWRPDCGHCEKAVPDLKKFYTDYQDKGVKVMAVCTKLGKEYEKCWKGVDDKGIGEFVNVGDQYQRSKILANYNASRTPKIFVLDKNNKILMKGIGAPQLPDVMEELLRRAEAQAIE